MQANSPAGGYWFRYNGSGVIQSQWSDTSGNFSFYTHGSTNYADSTVRHFSFEVDRTAQTVRLLVDGVQEGTTGALNTVTGAMDNSSTDQAFAAAITDAGRNLDGCLFGFSVTKGRKDFVDW